MILLRAFANRMYTTRALSLALGPTILPCMSTFAAICIAVLGQWDPEAEGWKPYILQLSTEDEPVRVLVDEEALEEALVDKDVVKFTAVRDEPWLGPPEERQMDIQRQFVVDWAPEDSIPRQSRLEQGWKAAGGIQLSTPSGTRWVLERDYQWSQKAKNLADAAFTREIAAVPVEARGGPTEARATAGPPFWKVWGPHVGILAGALALCGIVVGLAIRSRS